MSLAAHLKLQTLKEVFLPGGLVKQAVLCVHMCVLACVRACVSVWCVQALGMRDRIAVGKLAVF